MRHEQYRELVNTYGTHPARWPEDRRVDALAYAYKHPEQAAKTNAGDAILDKALDLAVLPKMDTDLLMARILKAAQETKQEESLQIATPANDHPTRFLADDTEKPNALNWRTLAATLLVTMGVGFGIGQSISANSDYLAAENLLAYNSTADSNALNWSDDNTGTNQ